MEDLVQAEQQHGLEPLVLAPEGPGEERAEHVAEGGEVSDHPGRELPREGAFAGVRNRAEAVRDGRGEGAPVVQDLAEDRERGPTAAGPSPGRGRVRVGVAHSGPRARPGPFPSRFPGRAFAR